jgi:hypothetical protein
MRTKIKTTHEEQYSDGSRTLGMLYNYCVDLDGKTTFGESFPYIYKAGNYIFFNTMVDMIDYLLYGESKMKRAYLTEAEFDAMYDIEFIEGKFTEKLEWII